MKAFILTILATALLFSATADSIFPDDNWKSGIIPINEEGDDLFYLLFYSRCNASADPLVFWLQGGPGGSSEIDAFYQNGPYTLNDNLSLNNNPFSWNNRSNFVYLDQPVGTGFSKAASSSDYVVNEDQVSDDFLAFLTGFFDRHPEFRGRDLYITGMSYAGHYIPAIALALHRSPNPDIKLKGIAIGDGWVDPYHQYPAYNDFAFENNLTTNTWHEALKPVFIGCQNLINTGIWPDARDACEKAMNSILTDTTGAPKFNKYDIRQNCSEPPFCYDFSKVFMFLEQSNVQQALNTTGRPWVGSSSVVRTYLLPDWLVNLSDKVSALIETGIKILLYNGDKDFICNWRGGEAWTNEVKWIKQNQFQKTNYTVYNDTNGNTIGEFKKVDNFVFLRFYDAGHFVGRDQPLNAQSMILDHFDDNSILNRKNAADRQPVYRWVRNNDLDHFYTLDPTGEAAPTLGYKSEGIAFYTLVNQETDSSPLYRLYNNGQHFYTNDSVEQGNLLQNKGWQDEGNIGYVYNTDANGGLPIHRYYNSGLDRHFYTIHPEVESLAGWTEEKSVGYAFDDAQ